MQIVEHWTPSQPYYFCRSPIDGPEVSQLGLIADVLRIDGAKLPTSKDHETPLERLNALREDGRISLIRLFAGLEYERDQLAKAPPEERKGITEIGFILTRQQLEIVAGCLQETVDNTWPKVAKSDTPGSKIAELVRGGVSQEILMAISSKYQPAEQLETSRRRVGFWQDDQP